MLFNLVSSKQGKKKKKKKKMQRNKNIEIRLEKKEGGFLTPHALEPFIFLSYPSLNFSPVNKMKLKKINK